MYENATMTHLVGRKNPRSSQDSGGSVTTFLSSELSTVSDDFAAEPFHYRPLKAEKKTDMQAKKFQQLKKNLALESNWKTLSNSEYENIAHPHTQFTGRSAPGPTKKQLYEIKRLNDSKQLKKLILRKEECEDEKSLLQDRDLQSMKKLQLKSFSQANSFESENDEADDEVRIGCRPWPQMKRRNSQVRNQKSRSQSNTSTDEDEGNGLMNTDRSYRRDNKKRPVERALKLLELEESDISPEKKNVSMSNGVEGTEGNDTFDYVDLIRDLQCDNQAMKIEMAQMRSAMNVEMEKMKSDMADLNEKLMNVKEEQSAEIQNISEDLELHTRTNKTNTNLHMRIDTLEKEFRLLSKMQFVLSPLP